MALDEVTNRLERICSALQEAGIPFALVGGQAVALWVATVDPAAVRTTNNVDILLDRSDLPRARQAAHGAGFDYFEAIGVGMFLEQSDPNPRRGVHLLWSGERVRPENGWPAPLVAESEEIASRPVVKLAALVRMKLMANRDQDRVHLRDMIDVGLVTQNLLPELPAELSERLSALLREQSRL